MKKQLLTVITLLFISLQIVCQEVDSLYVWAYPELNIRLSKDPDSKVISHIPYGEKVMPDWSFASNYIDIKVKDSSLYENKMTQELKLRGKMVKVNYDGKIGYVFSGYLSNFPTFNLNMSFDDYLMREYDTLKTIQYKHPLYSDQKIYQNGIVSFMYSDCMGCGEITYIIPDISLQEGFLIAYNMLNLGNNSYLEYDHLDWHVIKRTEDYIEIRGSIEVDIFISIRKSYSYTTIIVGSYS